MWSPEEANPVITIESVLPIVIVEAELLYSDMELTIKSASFDGEINHGLVPEMTIEKMMGLGIPADIQSKKSNNDIKKKFVPKAEIISLDKMIEAGEKSKELIPQKTQKMDALDRARDRKKVSDDLMIAQLKKLGNDDLKVSHHADIIIKKFKYGALPNSVIAEEVKKANATIEAQNEKVKSTHLLNEDHRTEKLAGNESGTKSEPSIIVDSPKKHTKKSKKRRPSKNPSKRSHMNKSDGRGQESISETNRNLYTINVQKQSITNINSTETVEKKTVEPKARAKAELKNGYAFEEKDQFLDKTTVIYDSQILIPTPASYESHSSVSIPIDQQSPISTTVDLPTFKPSLDVISIGQISYESKDYDEKAPKLDPYDPEEKSTIEKIEIRDVKDQKQEAKKLTKNMDSFLKGDKLEAVEYVRIMGLGMEEVPKPIHITKKPATKIDHANSRKEKNIVPVQKEVRAVKQKESSRVSNSINTSTYKGGMIPKKRQLTFLEKDYETAEVAKVHDSF